MRSKLITIARVALGLLFVLSGLNGFFHFMPEPPVDGRAAVFKHALDSTGYIIPLLKTVELGAGLLLVSGRLIPLALALLAPVVLNIAAFHLFLAPQGLPVVAFMLAAGLVLAWRQRAAFRALLRAEVAVAGWGRLGERALGVLFLGSGLMGLLDRTPPPATPAAAALMAGFGTAGYFFPLLAGLQVAAGALLLARRFVPLALAALAPLVVHIAAYRIWVHTPGMLAVTAALLALYLSLAWAHRESFAPLLRARLAA
jgi:hypothetical protein